MQKVVDLYAQNVNPTQIAKRTGLKRKEVLEYIDLWRKTSVGSELVKARVEELLATMDEHYSTLIQKFWGIVNEIEDTGSFSPQYLAQKNSALKEIANTEAKRIELLQKSGLLDAADKSEEIGRVQRDVEKVIQIMREELCPECMERVFNRIGTEVGKAEPIEIIVVDE